MVPVLAASHRPVTPAFVQATESCARRTPPVRRGNAIFQKSEIPVTEPTYDVVAIGNAIVDVLSQSTDAFLAEAAMTAAGAPVEAIYIPVVDHSFEGRDPAETNATANRAINATFDFFHKLFDAKAK